MPQQLDILALEPFFGGPRRMMLETLIRCSRHRWTLLKLPPRRIERRLAAAAQWFAEQLSRHWVGRVDVLFSSEALNLSDFLRLLPQLGNKPSVVYFHDNQLPPPSAVVERTIDLVNLTTASSATECWFNSQFHMRSFISRAAALVAKHPELSNRTPIPELTRKSKVYRPPVDTGLLQEISAAEPQKRIKRNIFIDTRDADTRLLAASLGALQRRAQTFELTTIGPVGDLPPDLPRTTIPELDDLGQYRALLRSGVYLSVKPNAYSDPRAVLAMSCGCRPVLPQTGVYPEMLPKSLHGSSLYEVAPDMLASRMQDVWFLERPDNYDDEIAKAVSNFDIVYATNAIDDRLEQLAGMGNS